MCVCTVCEMMTAAGVHHSAINRKCFCSAALLERTGTLAATLTSISAIALANATSWQQQEEKEVPRTPLAQCLAALSIGPSACLTPTPRAPSTHPPIQQR